MPLAIPLAEMEGVEPGKPNGVVAWELGELESSPLVREKAFRTSFAARK